MAKHISSQPDSQSKSTTLKGNKAIKRLSCRTLTLSQFLDALIEGDRTIIPEDKYENILHEFYSLMEGKNTSAIIIIDRDISYLRNRLFIIDYTVELLRKHYNQKLIDVLVQYGFNFNWSDLENLDKNLDRVINRSKADIVELNQKEELFKQQEALIKRGEETPEAMYDYFNGWLSAISDDAGYVITAEKIKVAEFCRRCVNLQAKAQKWQQDKVNR